ncbi:MAG TPA: heterodisulfide reductase-related iron-sulfur binding cluster [Nevskiales bacterium]|nr:heterodisulfide reductase-related iron-sulfur binding cluster [Nevskiales bacterium]
MIDPAHSPEQITRVLFQDFPAWMLAAFYLAAIAALATFGYGCYVQYRKYARGRALDLAGLGTRLVVMAKTVLSHRTLRRRDRAAGRAHAQIFFGFALLFLGTATITLEYDILKPLTGITFWHGAFYLWFSLVLDVAGIALLAGLVYMMYRRRWLALPKLDYARPDRAPDDPDYDRSAYRREDWAFLWALLLIGVSGFVLEAARLVWLQADAAVWDYRWWSPLGALLAQIFKGLGLDAEGAAALRLGLWWLHGLLALALIGLIPFTKAKHIFTAMAALALRDPLPVQRLPKADLAQERIGATRITDFTWKQLVHFDACTKCGRCHEACPANASGYPLSPRDLILSLRELSEALLSGRALPGPEALAASGDGVNQVRAETLWSCRTCAACVEICPVGIEHVPVIVEMRRALIEQGAMDPMVRTALQNIQKKGNSFGENKRKRPAWTKKLGFEIKDARSEAVDVLWFVGDFASFDPRYQKVSQAFARILHAAGVDFGILYEAEVNAGNDVRRVGEEGLYQYLVETNLETLSQCRFKRIVTTDPHSFNTLKNEYPEFGGRFEVEHASTLLERLLAEGKIKLKKPLAARVTYHDPCHLGRYNKGFEAPRQAIGRLGGELIELGRSRDNSFCCGAGGGRIWTPDPLGREKPSENRIREAAALGEVETVVVNCPKCMNMLEDAVKTTGHEGKLKIRELIELVAECMDFGEEAVAAAAGPALAEQE